MFEVESACEIARFASIDDLYTLDMASVAHDLEHHRFKARGFELHLKQFVGVNLAYQFGSRIRARIFRVNPIDVFDINYRAGAKRLGKNVQTEIGTVHR